MLLSLDLTLPTAHHNVALDEALLDAAEMGDLQNQVLRMWCPSSPAIVLGRSSKVEQEVNVEYCRSLDIPIVRRCSGGATILTSENCLMYAVVLNYERNPTLRMLDAAHKFVMEKIRNAISSCGVATQRQGTCDLTIDNKKVSGNALRCKRNWLVYHGTLICDGMDLQLISDCLGNPRRQPEYRQGRSHAEFLTHIPIGVEVLKSALIQEWNCSGQLDRWPEESVSLLVSEKYSQDDWNLKH